jgi:riboflavin kinase/FMN adenylyltransferase
VTELAAWCAQAGSAFRVAEALTDADGWISSSRVRSAILAGQVAVARALLGRPFRSTGVVGYGAQRGRTIGFPTANIEQVATLLPAEGVYAGRAWVAGNPWAAAVNLGPNPTFAEERRKLEVHLIGFTGDLYGQTLTLEWLERLRGTQPFASVADLSAQLRLDVVAAAALVAGLNQ